MKGEYDDQATLALAMRVAMPLLEQLTREIQDSVMAIRAQPVKSVFQRIPRLVREVAAMTGKQVRLVTEGEGTEVDKTVLGIEGEHFEHTLEQAKKAKGTENDLDLDADDLRTVVAQFKLIVRDQSGRDFPQDPHEQLMLAILAVAMHRTGDLTHGTVVATVMANLGFQHAMTAAGISVIETGVGDRYVLEAMRAGGYVLGGEQSGHVVMSEYATTGDGILTGLHVLAEVARSGESLAGLSSAVTKLPQVLVNVRGVDRTALDSSDTVRAAVAEAEARLGDTGRVLLRPSGTEPVIRVMVEALTQEEAQRVTDELAAVVLAELAID